MLRRWKNRWRRARLRRLGVDVEAAVPLARLGDGSGAWTVAAGLIGADGIVYSFGAGTDISFDLAIHRITGAEVHIFDPTPRSVEWMRRQRLPEGLSFHEIGIGAGDGEAIFHPPRRPTSSHYTPVRRYRQPAAGQRTVHARVERLQTIASRLGHTRIDLVKMDIEGGEYDVIAAMLDGPPAIRQLAVEFHHGYPTIPLSRTVAAIALLRQRGFRLVHVSERTYEMTFVHRGALEGP